jgi:signal transduction histidine kinase
MGELTIKSETSDSQLLISVSDTGAGLPPEQGEEIFKAFLGHTTTAIDMPMLMIEMFHISGK